MTRVGKPVHSKIPPSMQRHIFHHLFLAFGVEYSGPIISNPPVPVVHLSILVLFQAVAYFFSTLSVISFSQHRPNHKIWFKKLSDLMLHKAKFCSRLIIRQLQLIYNNTQKSDTWIVFDYNSLYKSENIYRNRLVGLKKKTFFWETKQKKWLVT